MSEFEEFWRAYPRRREKIRARTAYDKARKIGSQEEIMEGVKQYARERRGQDEKYTKHPATWLNAGCWMDYEPVQLSVGTALAFKCRECLQVSIGSECNFCRRFAHE